MTPFWRTWLTIWAWGVIVFGIVLAGAAFPATDDTVLSLFAIIGPPDPAFDLPMRFSTGLTGALSIGWGLTSLAFFKLADQGGVHSGSAWRLLLGGVLLWWLIDSSISIATGYALNAVSNTVLLILLLIPLVNTGALSEAPHPRAK